MPNHSSRQHEPNLKQLLQLDPRVVLLQDLVKLGALQRHSIRADLTHPDAVAPTLAIERHADEVTARITLFIEIYKTVSQREQRPEPQGPQAGAAGCSDNFRIDRPLGWSAIDSVLLERAQGPGNTVRWTGSLDLPTPLPKPLRVSILEAQLLRADGGRVAEFMQRLSARREAGGAAFELHTATIAGPGEMFGARVVFADATVVSP